MSSPHSTRLRWKSIAACVLAGALASRAATGSCLPLPSQDLWALDALTEAQPEQAIRDARARIAANPGRSGAFVRAQLFAATGDAAIVLSQPEQVVAAIKSARAELQSLTKTGEVLRLALRLDLLETQLTIVTGDPAPAVAAVTGLLRDLPDDSLERACALSVRAIAYDFMRKPDLSVSDGLAAYRIAREGQWKNAQLEAAGTLSRMFSRAGLFPQAERMIDELIAIAKSDNRTALLSTGEYERGMLLARAGRYADARAALQLSKDYANDIGDRFGVAAANANLCWTVLREGDLAAAAQYCYGDDEALAAGQREDLILQMIGNRAYLDIERNRPQEALRKLNQILTPTLHQLLPGSETQFYWDRARALRALNRIQEANADLVRMHELEAAAGNAQRNQQVAVLSALIASEELSAENRKLQERLALQQREADFQRERRTTIALAMLVVVLLLGCLLWISRRHSRALRRQEVILRTAGHNAPDAFVIFDAERRVMHANRNLCGVGDAPVIGEPVSASVPSILLPTLKAAIDEAFKRRAVNIVTATLPGESGALRTFEIFVVPAIDLDHVVGGTVRAVDVTDHQELERQVIDSESQERQRLSKELHEGIGQQLAGVNFLLGRASGDARRGSPQAGEVVDQAVRYVQEAIEAMRELARGLAPVKIGMGSLTVALKSLVDHSVERFRIAVHCDCRVDGIELSDLAADHIYSICRDAVTYAAVHGRCSKVAIDVKVVDAVVTVTITDDGSSVPSDEESSQSLGIRMIGYRTRLLGGQIRITARPDGGTCLVATVPLDRVAARK